LSTAALSITTWIGVWLQKINAKFENGKRRKDRRWTREPFPVRDAPVVDEDVELDDDDRDQAESNVSRERERRESE
jgi:hypothetical protein